MKLKRKIALLFASISLFSLGVGESINATHDLIKIYQGDNVDNITSGKGTLIYPNGDKYVGDFVDGEFHGKGTLTLKNGKKIKGKWLNGNRMN